MIDPKIKRKFWNKQVNAKKLGIEFNLSMEEYAALIEEAGITVDDIGHTTYNLARYNDVGPYAVGNCRFIKWSQNIADRKISRKMSEASRSKCQNMNQDSNIKAKRMAALTNRVWINNGEHNKRVNQDLLADWISQGYVKGRLTYN